MIIDFHTHIFPDKIAAATIEALQKKGGIPAYGDGTLSDLKKKMREAGVDYALVLPIATKPSQTPTINRFAVSINGVDNIFSLGSIHPDYEQWEEELIKIKHSGLKGIKLHPDYQGYFMDEEKLISIYEKLAELDLFAVFHGGVDVGFRELHHCTPEMVSKVHERVPNFKMVIAHTGGFEYWDEVEKYIVGKDIYIDISFTMKFIDEQQFLRIINNHRADRILFGTDFPWASHTEEIQRVKALPIGEELRERIFSKNAKVLLDM